MNQQVVADGANNTMDRPFDVIIFGASSSVGKFLVEELALVVDKYYPSSNSQTPLASASLAKQLVDPAIQFAQTNQRRRSVPRQVEEVKWAVAGRSAVKLSETLCRAELSTGIKNLSAQIPVVLADLHHQKSLLDMCQKTQLIINCVGPYSEFGHTLIEACLDTGTNYIDLAHETTFIESARQKYSERARQLGVFIINGCGFQSMSAEMGLNFTKQVADGQVDEIKIVLSLNDARAQLRPPSSWPSRSCISTGAAPNSCGIVSLGMWNSLLIEKSREIPVKDRLHQKNLPPLQAMTAAEVESQSAQSDATASSLETSTVTATRQLERKDTQSLVKDIVQFRNRNSSSWLQLFQGLAQNGGRGYCCPTNSLTGEESQLIRGEMTNYELRRPDLDSQRGWRPVRCTSFISLKSFSGVCIALIWLFIFDTLVKWSPFRRIMKSFPTLSSLGYVNGHKRELDRDSLSHIKYCQTFIAYGTPSDDSGDPLERREAHSMRKQVQLLVSRVIGPEPNHVATATFATQAALALLVERDHLPGDGGLMTPGAAFAETNIIYQLRRRNIKFEVLKKA